MQEQWIIQGAEVGRRLRAAMIPQAHSEQVVAACPGVTLEELQSFMLGQGPLTEEQLRAIALFLNVRFTQLLLGQEAELSSQELRLVLAFRQLDELDRHAVMRAAYGLGNMPITPKK